jgi:hypothetical protein
MAVIAGKKNRRSDKFRAVVCGIMSESITQIGPIVSQVDDRECELKREMEIRK